MPAWKLPCGGGTTFAPVPNVPRTAVFPVVRQPVKLPVSKPPLMKSARAGPAAPTTRRAATAAHFTHFDIAEVLSAGRGRRGEGKACGRPGRASRVPGGGGRPPRVAAPRLHRGEGV